MLEDSIDKPPFAASAPADATPEPDVPVSPPLEAAAAPSPALTRFSVCRWTQRGQGNGATHCGHPEVLPFAGAHGFTPASWCGDCGFFKVKRVVRKNYDQAY